MMSPINDSFLSGSLDRTIRLWDLRSPNCQGLMHLNGPPIASFDPEGLIFAAGIDSRQLKLYDLRTFDKVGYMMYMMHHAIIYFMMVRGGWGGRKIYQWLGFDSNFIYRLVVFFFQSYNCLLHTGNL